MDDPRIGIQLGATTPPSQIGEMAELAEHLGYSEIWMAEDYFQLGGISSVAAALAATERIPIGLGVVAAAARHPAATAMEFATLAGVFPGRFMAGLGHGAPNWVRQMGLEPASPLGLLREATDAIQRLLGGAEVSCEGDYFSFERVRLEHRPACHLPLYLGVHGPASLRLAGELGDGTLLGWLSSPGYVAWARERIDEGRTRADRTDQHSLVALCLLSVSEAEPDRARRDLGAWIAPMMASMIKAPQLTTSDAGQRVVELVATDSARFRAAGPPDDLLGDFVAAGDLASCARSVANLLDAGADRVVLVSNPAGYRTTSEMAEQIRAAAPLLGSP